MKQTYIPQLAVVRPHYKPGTAITQQRRLDLIRRYVNEDDTAPSSRVAICLMLLYAQPLTRILRLTIADIVTHEDGDVTIAFGTPPAVVPEPFASLLQHLVAHRDLLSSASSASRWLFPGLVPGQPLTHGVMVKRLHRLGFPKREARISALRQLVLQAPAPVIADALGFHHTTTTRQVVNLEPLRRQPLQPPGLTQNPYPTRSPWHARPPAERAHRRVRRTGIPFRLATRRAASGARWAMQAVLALVDAAPPRRLAWRHAPHIYPSIGRELPFRIRVQLASIKDSSVPDHSHSRASV